MPLIGPPKGGDFYAIDANTKEAMSEVFNGGRVDEFLSSHPWTCSVCGTVNCEWNKRCIYCWIRHRVTNAKP